MQSCLSSISLCSNYPQSFWYSTANLTPTTIQVTLILHEPSSMPIIRPHLHLFDIAENWIPKLPSWNLEKLLISVYQRISGRKFKFRSYHSFTLVSWYGARSCFFDKLTYISIIIKDIILHKLRETVLTKSNFLRFEIDLYNKNLFWLV